jgi:hypothetical protein
MAVGQTEEIDGAHAAADLLEQCAVALDGAAPQAGMLLACHDLEFEEFLAAIYLAHPDLQLIGCTTLAPISSASVYAEGSTTLTLFASDVIDFTAGLGTGVARDVGLAAREAVLQATTGTDKPVALAIVTPSVEGFDPAAISIAMGEALGDNVPVFGGGAVPDFPVTAPWEGGTQVFGRELITDALPVLLLSGPLAVSVGVRHGWKPVGRKAVVTRSKHEQVYEIDGEPVIDFYRHYLGATGEPAIANPLAIFDPETSRTYLRAPLAWDESEGSATFLGSVPEGSVVQIAMASMDEILEGAQASVADALSGFPEGAHPVGALISACAVRNFLLGTKTSIEVKTINDGLGSETCVTVVIGT